MRAELEDSFTEFAGALLPGLRRLAYAVSGDWHRADDLVQRALERAVRGPGEKRAARRAGGRRARRGREGEGRAPNEADHRAGDRRPQAADGGQTMCGPGSPSTLGT